MTENGGTVKGWKNYKKEEIVMRGDSISGI